MAALSNKPVGRILISNDDGIDSIGITILREIATALQGLAGQGGGEGDRGKVSFNGRGRPVR